MRLLLIRHGETVDNVAGLYAGSRDSALTVHGVEQARRLGEHLLKTDSCPTHIFASPLQRALKTAESLLRRDTHRHAAALTPPAVDVVTVDELKEQDFGFYEGKPFYARSKSTRSGKEEHRDKHRDEPGFVDVESKDSLARRADTFIDAHLLPLVLAAPIDERWVIAVVSHGILLSSLWKRILLRLTNKTLSIAPEVISTRGEIVLEHLGGWSNTGYLDLSLKRDEGRVVQEYLDASHANPNTSLSRSLHGWSVIIQAVDSKQHLVGMKRQRGGIGRMAHDEGQKKLDSFFKRKRTS